MFANIVALLVVAYFVAKFIKGGALGKVKEFTDLTKTSAKELGGRGTAHAIIDGLFDAGKTAKEVAAQKAAQAKQVASQKAAGLKPQDYKYDHESGELTIFICKGEDLVIGKEANGKCYALEMSVTGRATELNGKALERKLKYLRSKGKLSDSQERAIKDFFLKARK